MDIKANLDEDESSLPLVASNTKTAPNYQGPKTNVQYPLTVVYCGGFFFSSIKSIISHA